MYCLPPWTILYRYVVNKLYLILKYDNNSNNSSNNSYDNADDDTTDDDDNDDISSIGTILLDNFSLSSFQFLLLPNIIFRI